MKDPRLKLEGNEQRTNLLWESLKRYGTVYTFLSDLRLGQESEYIDGKHPIFKFRPSINKKSLWYVLNVYVCKFFSFSILRHKSVKIPEVSSAFKGVKFDLVVSRYLHPLCDYDYWRIAPLLIDIDDHPYQVYQTVYKNHLPFGMRTIGKYVTVWQTKYLLKKAIGGWLANKEQLILCDKNFGLLPNIPQTPSNEYKVASNERKNLFTIGTMGYEPNKEGVTCFLKDVWPLFHKKFPDVQYRIVGKGASEADANLWNNYDGVQYLGYVEDLEALYEKSLATIVPIYSGGGTCIKTLESMTFSRPCLSTKFGARGLSEDVIENEEGVLIFSNAENFVKAYEKLQDLNYRQMIEKKGRDVISQLYSVESFDNAVDEIILNMGL